MIWEKHPEMDAKLESLVVNRSLDWVEIGKQVGAPPTACRLRASRQKYEGWDCERKGGHISHVAAKVSSPCPPRIEPAKLWQEVEEVTERDVVRHQLERVVDVSIDDDRPIGLSFNSDQHIRKSGPIMMREMREDAELQAATEGLYSALAGDGVDNHIKHREAMANGGDKPADSWRLYDHYLGMFDGKIVAMVSGNHDDWTRDFTGVDQVGRLARERKIFYAPDEALIRLQVGDQEYRVLMRHQYNMNSRMNLGHAVKRLWEMGNDNFDVGVLGHHHEAACEPFIKHGLRRYALRPGSYQFTSSFSRRKGFVHSYPTCPTVIFWPNRRHLMGFWDVREAAGYLTYLREAWPDSDVLPRGYVAA